MKGDCQEFTTKRGERNEIFSTMDVLILCVGPSIGIFSIFPLSSRFSVFLFSFFFVEIYSVEGGNKGSFVYVH